MTKEKTKKEKVGMLDRILDSIERVGNKLPDPITLFLGLAVVVVKIGRASCRERVSIRV